MEHGVVLSKTCAGFCSVVNEGKRQRVEMTSTRGRKKRWETEKKSPTRIIKRDQTRVLGGKHQQCFTTNVAPFWKVM